MALRRVMKQAGFPVRADFIAWAKTAGWHQLNDKTFQGFFGASHLRSTRETPWHIAAQVVTYSCRHSPHLDAERELPRMAGFWQQAYRRVPDGYSGRIITPTQGDIALLCGQDPVDLDTARRQAAKLSRQLEQLNTDMALLSEQVTDRNEQILQLRRQLERAETGKAAVEGTAVARQEALEQLRAELAEAHRALETDDQRLNDVHGELQKAQHRATKATAAAFTVGTNTPPAWSTVEQSGGDRLRRLRDAPAPTTATPGLRILARHLLEHAIEHDADLDELVTTANISPEIIEPLLTAALLPGRDTVLAIAAKCGADPERTTQLYEQAYAEQRLRDTAENPTENLTRTSVFAGEKTTALAEDMARIVGRPRRPAPPDLAAGSHPGSPRPTFRRLAVAIALVLVAALASSGPRRSDTDDSAITANSPTAPNTQATTSSPATSSAPATPAKAITDHGDGSSVIVSRDGRRRAALDRSSYSEGKLQVWNVKGGQRVRTIDLSYNDTVARIALSVDGSYLAAITVSDFQFWGNRSRSYTLHVWKIAATDDLVIKRYIDVRRRPASLTAQPFRIPQLTLRFLKGTTLLSSNDVDDDDRIDDRLTLMNAADGGTIGTRP
jgi:hypothetical protein